MEEDNQSELSFAELNLGEEHELGLRSALHSNNTDHDHQRLQDITNDDAVCLVLGNANYDTQQLGNNNESTDQIAVFVQIKGRDDIDCSIMVHLPAGARIRDMLCHVFNAEVFLEKCISPDDFHIAVFTTISDQHPDFPGKKISVGLSAEVRNKMEYLVKLKIDRGGGTTSTAAVTPASSVQSLQSSATAVSAADRGSLQQPLFAASGRKAAAAAAGHSRMTQSIYGGDLGRANGGSSGEDHLHQQIAELNSQLRELREDKKRSGEAMGALTVKVEQLSKTVTDLQVDDLREFKQKSESMEAIATFLRSMCPAVKARIPFFKLDNLTLAEANDVAWWNQLKDSLLHGGAICASVQLNLPRISPPEQFSNLPEQLIEAALAECRGGACTTPMILHIELALAETKQPDLKRLKRMGRDDIRWYPEVFSLAAEGTAGPRIPIVGRLQIGQFWVELHYAGHWLSKFRMVHKNCACVTTMNTGDGWPTFDTDVHGEWKMIPPFELPSDNHWNPNDKHSGVSLSNGNLTAATIIGYAGSSVRSVRPIPGGQRGIFYFEIKVTADAFVGVGLSNKQFPIGHGIGCINRTSNGVHARGYYNAGSVWKDGTKLEQLPRFGAGDVVGCGVLLDTRQMFFTRNGIRLGNSIILETAQGDLYPTVSLGDGATIEAFLGPSSGFMWKGQNP